MTWARHELRKECSLRDDEEEPKQERTVTHNNLKELKAQDRELRTCDSRTLKYDRIIS